MEESNSKKTIVIVSLIILVLIICIFVLKSCNRNSGFLVIDDYVIECSNDEIKTANIDDIQGYKFKMIYDNSYIGDYTFDHIDDLNGRLFFENEDGVNALKTPLLGLDDNTSLVDFEIEEMNDDDFDLFIETAGTRIDYELSDLSYGKKVTIDDIKIYAVKYEGEYESDDYSLLFISKDNNTYVLDEDYPKKDNGGYLFYSFDIMYILDINKDDKYELVVSKNYYDVIDYSIYELDNNFLELYYTGK